jgi:hypothetical protein
MSKVLDNIPAQKSGSQTVWCSECWIVRTTWHQIKRVRREGRVDAKKQENRSEFRL